MSARRAIHKDTQNQWQTVRNTCIKRFGTLRAAFCSWNTNSRKGDKVLDGEEFRAGVQKLGFSTEMSAGLWRMLDADGSGDISMEEFCNVVAATATDATTQTDISGHFGSKDYEILYEREYVASEIALLVEKENANRAELSHAAAAAQSVLISWGSGTEPAYISLWGKRGVFLVAREGAARQRVISLEREIRESIYTLLASSATQRLAEREAGQLERELAEIEADISSFEAAMKGVKRNPAVLLIEAGV